MNCMWRIKNEENIDGFRGRHCYVYFRRVCTRETVVTISADDVGCVMTGGVGRAEVVSTLKSSIPKFDLSKISKKNLARV